MFIVESEVSGLLRKAYAKHRPDWKLLGITLVARKSGGFIAVVVCKNITAPAEGEARFFDEVCYIAPKGEVTCLSDIANLANFLIWFAS